ncbi:MAG: hypothetical protein ACR2HH_08345 [Chthoniobacterales bacterium]
MRKKFAGESGLFNIRIVIGVLICSLGASLGWLALGASPANAQRKRAEINRRIIVPNSLPASGNLNPSGPTITWAGTATGGSSLDESTCVEGVNCDTYKLTLTLTPADWSGKKAHVKISWPNAGDDFDVFIHKGTAVDGVGRPTGPLVGSSATGGKGPEEIDLDPTMPAVGTGDFLVHVVYFTVTPTDQYAGEASVLTAPAPTPTPTPSPGATPTPTPAPAGMPRFQNFVAPPGFGENAGEPSVGSNWLTENAPRTPPLSYANSNGPVPNGGTTTYYGGFLTELLRITFDDCSSPAFALWEKKPVILAATPRALGDPILFTDHGYPALIGPGRTFVSQEEAQAGSTTDFTDNDGDMFTPSQGAGAPAGVDHQTVAAGPYSTNATVVPPGVIPPSSMPYPSTGPRRAVYYASQSVSDARTSRSDDGGLTFGPAVPMYTTADCGGLHGHLKVAPDGTVYVPNNACGGTSDPVGHVDGQQAVIVSENNGLTWSIRKIPTTDTKSDRDPSVGIATDGTIYVGQQSKDGHARISVSHNKGLTWDQFPGQLQAQAYDVGAQLGIQNMVFAEVVAGDPDRAAFAFFGTTTPDDTSRPTGAQHYSDPDFPGVWYLFISTTFDGGQTWTTQNATPNDPIQRGGICGSGTCRNLLDFFDATVDKEGRVLIGGEDGCIGGCVNGGANSFTAKAFISRQSGGKRMFAAFDGPPEPVLPGAPAVSGTLTGSTVKLSWPVPDGGGSPIIAYKVFKGSGNSFPLLATVAVPTFTDPNYTSGQSYRVTAVNQAVGEGPYCHEFTPTSGPVASACNLPGILVINDVNADGTDADAGQNTPADPRVNIQQLFVAEPFVNAGSDQLFFTLQVKPSTAGSAPPNSQWLIIWNRQGTQPGDPNDAKNDRIYLAMVTDAAGTPRFEYGKFGIPINTSPPPLPDPSANAPTKFGDADSGTFDPLTGLIKITLAKSKLRTIDGGSAKYLAGTDLAGINVRTYFNRPDYQSDASAPVRSQRSQNNASDISDNSNYALVGNASCALAPTIASAVSRKAHGPQTFDVRLMPPDSRNGIECRTGGGSGAIAGSYQVVITFTAPVTFTGVSATGGASATSSPTPGSAPTSDVTVNLSNVPNAQVTTITLTGTSTGSAAPVGVDVPLAVLIGDVNGTGLVDGNDVSSVQGQTRQPVDDQNFRNDVNVTDLIDGNDVSITQSHTRTSLP